MDIMKKSPVATSIPFDNDTNGFAATDTQAAIEESLTISTGIARYGLVTTFNGTVTNGQWLGYNNLLPGDTVPILVARNSVLEEITFSWNSTNVDGTFDLYLNGTSPGDIVYSTSFTDSGPTIRSGINLTILAGDQIRGRWVDTGDNPPDAAICYFFRATYV